MSEIVKFTDESNTLPAKPEDLIKGLQNVTAVMQSASGGIPYLRLLRSGVFAYGPENIEPEPESIWAVNPYSVTHGFACWGDGELLGERMVPFNQTPPNRAELPDYGTEWDQQVGMQLQCLSGEDKDTVVLYRGTSTGLRNAVKKLIDHVIAQVQLDAEHIVPVIRLEVDSYHHKKYGDINIPVLAIQHWLTFETGQPAPREETLPAELEAEHTEDVPGEVDAEQNEGSPETPPKRRRGRQPSDRNQAQPGRRTTTRRRRKVSQAS